MALALMRRHRRWLFAFLWVVIAAFIILYLTPFQGTSAGSPGETLASVGGMPISVGEFQKSYLRQREMYERIYQGRLDAAALKSMGLETQVFEGLVADRLVVLEAQRLGLTVTDDAVAHEIATSPQFQQNGRFVGSAEIKRLLDLRGMTEEEFEEGIRADLLKRRLEALVSDGVTVTPAEAEQEFRRRTEQIKAEYVLVGVAPFKAQVAVADEDVKARFEARKDAYKLPEQRVVSYLLLDTAALKGRVTVTDRDVEAFYQEHKDDFKEPEQVCASHILIKVKAKPGDQEGHPDAEARKLAESALAQVKAGGDFAALAKKVSEDKGSAERGGDLGCFPRGRMVPDFDNAAFSLAAGETSALVKTSFGYHVIRAASHREETTAPLTQVKEQIRANILEQRGAALTSEKSDAVAEALRHGKTLDAAAKETGFALAKSAPFSRGEGVPPLTSPTLVARAFALKQGEVEKQPFPVARGVAFIALDEVKPPRVPALAEVKEKVKADLLDEAAFAKALETARSLRARAERDGLDKAAVAIGQGLVRKETPNLVGRGQPIGDLGSGAALDDAAFGLPEKVLSEPVRVPGGYAVLRVLEKKPFDPAAFEAQKASLVASLKSAKKGQLFQAYMSQARQRFTIERHPEAMKRVVG
jgi:peptidyl-prolyl cis-trans isomerase D